MFDLDIGSFIALRLPPPAGGPADDDPVPLAGDLHLIVPPHADLLQEPDGDLDAKAVVGPLDHMRARHRGDLLRDVSMPDTCLLRLFQLRHIVDQQADYGFQSACFLLRRRCRAIWITWRGGTREAAINL